MPASKDRLSIGFESDFGSFSVESDDEIENVFDLYFIGSNKQRSELGKFCSISDAISAVAQQQSGCAEWDQLSPEQLPRKVHNIASWNFSQKTGTFPQVACS